MSGLVGSTPTLVLALCLLVLVGSLPALPTTPVASRLRALLPSLLALASLLATSTALWLLLERPGTLPNTFPGQIAKYAATELNAAKEPTVLIVDGGSYVLNAVDCDDLMDELGKLDTPPTRCAWRREPPTTSSAFVCNSASSSACNDPALVSVGCF